MDKPLTVITHINLPKVIERANTARQRREEIRNGPTVLYTQAVSEPLYASSTDVPGLLDEVQMLKGQLAASRTEATGLHRQVVELKIGNPDGNPDGDQDTSWALPGCAENCRHECGECRMGLGTHRVCDPRCTHTPRTKEEITAIVAAQQAVRAT